MMGGCGYGGCGGGYMMMGGCATCGGGYVMGGGGHAAAPCATCFGGVCTINPNMGAAVAQAAANEATLVVSLPEDATLTVDNEPTTSTSAQRVFVSPALEPGRIRVHPQGPDRPRRQEADDDGPGDRTSR